MFNQSTVAQMAEQVSADSRVCGSNPAKDPMVGASKIQSTYDNKQPHTINHREPSNGIHSFKSSFSAGH